MQKLPSGIYDLLYTTELHDRLKHEGVLDRAEFKDCEPLELRQHLATLLSRVLSRYISDKYPHSHPDEWAEQVSKMCESPTTMMEALRPYLPHAAQTLQQIAPAPPLLPMDERPDTPLSVSALLTGSSRSPALRTQLIKELGTCDRADWLVSFIKFSGILPLLPALEKFTQNPSADGTPRLRIATTSYMGATDIKAVQRLMELPNTEIRISYDTKRTRLHAKAYLFYRDTGFSSAYIGSANVSKAALDEGLEWTAKISEYESDHLWQHAIATFESHWEDTTEFSPCNQDDLPTLQQALVQESNAASSESMTSFFDIRPFDYQKVILEDISAERESGKNKFLVIAATGTGKTMVAAFDYKKFCEISGHKSSLLFVAHRKEILIQARAAFRQVLRDGSFGDIVSDGAQPSQMQHLFCTVQSWNSREYDTLDADHFNYVVLDEAHHATASSYQKLVKHVAPQSLLGLTATPERMDGGDIRDDFGGSFTHEIRLTEAIERALLCPFHYYGIPDLDGLDFSGIAWKRGGYDRSQLNDRLSGNKQRATWVMSQLENHVADIQKMRGIGFCVSKQHALFMAEVCNEHGVPAMALIDSTSKPEREQAQQRLGSREINLIFVVDLYNEGVDIPTVDTVLFLRPTESLTLFLQQLGRGLRLHDDKSQLTVLDFIAPQSRHFSFAKRFRALTSRPDLRIDNQIKSDMPFVPSGCVIHLEKQAKEHVLSNIRAAAANLRGRRLLSEITDLQRRTEGQLSLKVLLDALHLDTPDEVYKQGLPSTLFSKIDGVNAPSENDDLFNELAKGFRRLLLMDDTTFLDKARCIISGNAKVEKQVSEMLNCVLWNNKKPAEGTLEQVHNFLISHVGVKRDLVELLDWLLEHKTPLPQHTFDFAGPLSLHGSYTRKQILLALGEGSFESPKSSREGVFHVPKRKLDVFFADIDKSEADYSPTTMYEDYAITNKLFHWQSQSTTSESSPVGKRYIHHVKEGYTPLLFLRNRKKLANGFAAPYFFAGALRYKEHAGEKPLSIKWELEHSLPARTLEWARRP